MKYCHIHSRNNLMIISVMYMILCTSINKTFNYKATKASYLISKKKFLLEYYSVSFEATPLFFSVLQPHWVVAMYFFNCE